MTDHAHHLAAEVRTALDKRSCPDAFMRIAYEAVVEKYPDGVLKALLHAASRFEGLRVWNESMGHVEAAEDARSDASKMRDAARLLGWRDH